MQQTGADEECVVRLRNKVAVVTGGTRGLGRAVAERYLVEGARVICASRQIHAAKRLLDEFPDRAVFHPVDVGDRGSVAELMRFGAESFGRIDVLVTAAGIGHDARIGKLEPARWREMVSTNLTGTFLCLREAVPHLRESASGRVITVSSVFGSVATVGAAGYCATKAGIEMLTRVGALELAPEGILVNCIAPGFISSGMGHAVEANEKVWPTYRRKLALGRTGRESEIADAAVFLAGPESTYVNGHILEVSGGLSWA